MEQKEPRKTGAIIATIAAILLCGCPGLGICVFGIWTATGSMPDFFNGYGTIPSWIGFASLCVALIFVLIAVLVPVLTLRKKKGPAEADAVDVLPPNEPLPPAS
jgi:TRAP-type C4-dicarboxylate transport system permease small subunit